jgi:hypothetical protein
MHEVNAAIEEMRKDHDPLASHIFVSGRLYPRQIQHQERQGASFVGSAQLAAGMRSRVSWRPWKVQAPFRDGSSASVRANPHACAKGRTGLRATVVNDVQARGFTAATPQSILHKSPRLTGYLQMRRPSTRFPWVQGWGEFLELNTTPAQKP